MSNLTSKWVLFFSLNFIYSINILILAQSDDGFVDKLCENDFNYTKNSSFQTNLDRALANLPFTNSGYGFFNSTSGSKPDTATAIGLCRGDYADPVSCRSCVNNAILKLREVCPNQKDGSVYYDHCMVRYSGDDILGKTEIKDIITHCSAIDVTGDAVGLNVLKMMMNNLTVEAASGGSLRKDATGTITQPPYTSTTYGLAQCTPDLSSQQCSDCLEGAVGQIARLCFGKIGMRVLLPMCNIRYEDYQFYNTAPVIPQPPPPPPASEDLSSSKDFWNIKVRVLRRWGNEYRIDLVLIDEKGQKIQGFVKEKLVEKFDKDLVEDAVIVIKKCGIAEQKDRFPVIVSKKKINFYTCTQVSSAVAFQGHPYGFLFKNFPEIDEKLMKQVHTVDVIGNVISCGNLDVFRNKFGKESKKINFPLQDLQGNVVNCTLWDGYAENFSAYIANHKSNEHVISIIQHGKLKCWRDAVTVQNDMYGTRVFLNEEVQEINDFRRSLILNEAGVSTSQSQLSSQTTYPMRNEFLLNTQRKHVDEIRECDQEGAWVVVGTIRSIEEEFGWFYAGCRKCSKKVFTKTEYLSVVDSVSKDLEEAASDSLWCPRCQCQSTSVVPKFRVQFRVQDETGSVSFLMFDKDVVRVLGMGASDIRDRQMKSGNMESFPHEIENMVNKLLAFKVVVSKHNLKKNYHVYTVTKLCDDPSIITDLLAKDFVNEVNDDQDTVDGTCVKLDESSQFAETSKDAVSVTGSSVAQEVEKDVEKDTETSPAAKRPIQATATGKPTEGDCSATKRTRKKLMKYDV